MKLTGGQIKRLCDEIDHRFQIDELRRVVRFRLDVALEDVASSSPGRRGMTGEHPSASTTCRARSSRPRQVSR